MPTKVYLFRLTHPDGSAKDWAYPADTTPSSPAFTVFYGRTGSTLRQTETPAARCRDGNPLREAEHREREKVAKGYDAVGPFWLADNRRDLKPVIDWGVVSDPDPSPTPPQLYWRWRPESGMDAADPQTQLEAALRQVEKQLAQVGWPLPRIGWPLPLNDPHPITSRLASVIIIQTTCSLALTTEYQAGVAFWLLLARACPCVQLADDQGRSVTAWPPHLPVDPAILEALGLKPKDLDQLLAAMSGDDWFF